MFVGGVKRRELRRCVEQGALRRRVWNVIAVCESIRTPRGFLVISNSVISIVGEDFSYKFRPFGSIYILSKT